MKHFSFLAKILMLIFISIFSMNVFAGIPVNTQLTDTTKYGMSVNLNSITVTSLYRNNVTTGSLIKASTLQEKNTGQAPDYVFNTMPGMYAYNDNGTQMGYCYFRIRGMGQERMNVTIDGMPWNEAEDFGCYFSNMPNLMNSMRSIKVEKGASVTNNGTAAYAGNVTLESADLQETTKFAELTAGSFNTYRANVVYNSGIHNKWGFHVSATTQQTDGYKDHGYNNSQSFIFKTGYFFNKNHSIDFLTMNGFHRNGQQFTGITAEQIPNHLNPFKQLESGNFQQETDNFFMTTNRLQYKGKFDKVFLTSSLYWNHLKGDYRIKDYTYYYDPVSPKNVMDNYDLVQHLYGINTTAKWYMLDNLALTGGINAYMFSRRHRGYEFDGNEVVNIWHSTGKSTYYDNTGKKPDINVFAKLQYTPVDKLHIDGSIQYRHTQLNYDVKQAATNKTYLDPANDTDQNYYWNFVNWGFNASYDINRHSQVYARYNVTNREPSRSDMFGAEYYQGELLATADHERVNDLELGYEFRSRQFKFNFNSYYMDFSNELVATGELSPMNGLPLHTQHDAYRVGMEVAADYMPINYMHVIMNCAWSSNKLKNIDGHKMNHTYSPSWIHFAEVNYTFNTNKLHQVKVGVNTNYRSHMYLDIANKHKLAGLFTLNAYASTWITKSIEVGCKLNNITNRTNYSTATVDSDTVYYSVDSPFSFMLTGKVYF